MCLQLSIFHNQARHVGRKYGAHYKIQTLKNTLNFSKIEKHLDCQKKLCVSKCVGPTAIMLFRAAVRGISISIS